MKVFSHVRSGSHFLAKALHLNFFKSAPGMGRPRGFVGHWSLSREKWLARPEASEDLPYKALWGGHPPSPRGGGIYIYRDGRDVLASMYYCLGFHHQKKPILPFKEWLRTPLDWLLCPSMRVPSGRRPPLPAEHWYSQVAPWLESGARSYVAPVVRYEELALYFTREMERIAKEWKLEPPASWKRPDPCGHFPGPCKVGRWRGLFDDEDLKFFFDTVPHDFAGLWHLTYSELTC